MPALTVRVAWSPSLCLVKGKLLLHSLSGPTEVLQAAKSRLPLLCVFALTLPQALSFCRAVPAANIVMHYDSHGSGSGNTTWELFGYFPPFLLFLFVCRGDLSLPLISHKGV